MLIDKNTTFVNKNTIKIATYNTLLSKHTEDIINNIVKIAKEGVIIFCLQEILKIDGEPFIIEEILQHLGKEWKAIHHLGNEQSFLSFGTCILWNTRLLTLEKTEKILLPKMNHVSIHELLFDKLVGQKGVPVQRRAINAQFKYKGFNLLIASLHLDSFGGEKNRTKQLDYFLEKIRINSKCPYQIICGDFNSFDLLKSGNERESFQYIFGSDFVDAARNISWTADINKIDIPKSFPFFVLLIKLFHVHIKRKLDYIWVKNFGVRECITIDIPGSDHLPVIATLELK